MSWRLVDGVALPDPVGGHDALDFCNTRAGWGTVAPKEYLTHARVLDVWARRAGLVLARDDVGLREDALTSALALREATYRCALGLGGEPDWAVVAGCAAAARRAATLRGSPARAPAVWRIDPGAPDAALHAVALAVEDLLTSSLAAAVAACPGVGCGWLFADPRGRRRWCSMAVCGNRAKARRYAAAHADPHPRPPQIAAIAPLDPSEGV